MRKLWGRRAREREAVRQACIPNTELGRRARNLYELFYGEPCPWRPDPTAAPPEIVPPAPAGEAYHRNLEAARAVGFDHTRDV